MLFATFERVDKPEKVLRKEETREKGTSFLTCRLHGSFWLLRKATLLPLFVGHWSKWVKVVSWANRATPDTREFACPTACIVKSTRCWRATYKANKSIWRKSQPGLPKCSPT